MKTNGQSVKEEIGADTPPAPENLIGVFTGSSVVLTWDEVDEQDISIYRIYRAEGGEFEMIGEALTPAFTDRDVKADTKYYYRVTAVSSSESPLSEVVLISTHKNTK
jgi:fibronectin type 3 domain-containing protein